jgi:hypothetical protein
MLPGLVVLRSVLGGQGPRSRWWLIRRQIRADALEQQGAVIGRRRTLLPDGVGDGDGNLLGGQIRHDPLIAKEQGLLKDPAIIQRDAEAVVDRGFRRNHGDRRKLLRVGCW